jgi:hypothetical protein
MALRLLICVVFITGLSGPKPRSSSAVCPCIRQPGTGAFAVHTGRPVMQELRALHSQLTRAG